ncbi:hypothetical protein ACFW9X_14045, partial [Streptomyces sp. NPDC059466]|uniref:hypothetical protein n=1 Tax=Streptomyces sp. NPDC059466 TaxID=3346843 RepID=UPI00367BC804
AGRRRGLLVHPGGRGRRRRSGEPPGPPPPPAVLDGEDFTPHTEEILAHARLVDEVEQAAATLPAAP